MLYSGWDLKLTLLDIAWDRFFTVDGMVGKENEGEQLQNETNLPRRALMES